MAKLDKIYVKVADDPTFWAVDKGKRTKINSIEEMQALGLRPLRMVSLDGLEEIPINDPNAKKTRGKK